MAGAPSLLSFMLLFSLLFLTPLMAEPKAAPKRKPKGGDKGVCKPSGVLKVSKSFNKNCKECCKPGKSYQQYECSPPVTEQTPAVLTVNGFQKGQEGGGPASCDGKYHNNNEKVVALSTGWFAKRSRCGKFVTIRANGKSVRAKVVDECDSVQGCDVEHGNQPPCPNNIVDGSPAVWKALGISTQSDKYGWMSVTWTD